MSEIDLKALRRGDESAFRELVKKYHSTLFRLAMIYSPNRAVAEETVQETWAAVLHGLDGFTGRASLRTWICRILVNVARRRAGMEARAVPFAGFDDDFTAIDPERFMDNTEPFPGHWRGFSDDWSRIPENRMLSRELQDVVSSAIDTLPASQREVITLRDVEGWNTVEVSKLLGIEEGNQRVLLHRARSRVRQALEDYLSAPPLVAA
jgi:RNA polymerase sigma-70 factor, ECF subfamily